MLRALRAFRKDREGAATVEFVIIFPFLITIVLSLFEAGWLMTRYMMLDRGVDLAVRDLRLGKDPGISHDELKDEVCGYAKIFKGCTTDLVLEVVPMDVNSAYPQNQPNCFDRTGELEPVIDFTPGLRGEIMFIRACVVIDPIFPGLGLGLQLPKDSSGGFQMVSYAAFMNEPS